jgi:pyruvate-formate lyase-activating enzyme
MYYGEIKTCDIANGVGVRVTLFVSGCTNHCYNCFQPQTWDFHYGQPFDAAAEQVFGHLKDEFYRGREFDSYIVHWNTRRRQIRLEGHTPEEFRSMSLAV